MGRGIAVMMADVIFMGLYWRWGVGVGWSVDFGCWILNVELKRCRKSGGKGLEVRNDRGGAEEFAIFQGRRLTGKRLLSLLLS
jgi:hypothetical protein